MENKLTFILLMPIPSYIILFSAIYSLFKINKIKRMFSYIKENGKCYRGRVKRIIKFTTKSEKNNGGYYYRNDYYMEIEYINSNNNSKNKFFSPMLRKLPYKADIICDVYVVDELPIQYKNEKFARNVIADNFS